MYLIWNKALWLDAANHVISFNQLVCFRYFFVKFIYWSSLVIKYSYDVYDIVSWLHHNKCWKYRSVKIKHNLVNTH